MKIITKILLISLAFIMLVGCFDRDTSAYHPSDSYLSQIYESDSNELYLLRRHKNYDFNNVILMKFNKHTRRWENISTDIILDSHINVDIDSNLYVKDNKIFLYATYFDFNKPNETLSSFTIVDMGSEPYKINTIIINEDEYSLNSQYNISYKNLYEVYAHNLALNTYEYLYDLPNISTIQDRLNININIDDYTLFCYPLQHSLEEWDYKRHQCFMIGNQEDNDSIYNIVLTKQEDNNWDMRLLQETKDYLLPEYYKMVFDYNLTRRDKLIETYPYYKKLLKECIYIGATTHFNDDRCYIDKSENLYLFKDEHFVGDRDIIFELYTPDSPDKAVVKQKFKWKEG